jgi:hypothetical protein
MVTHEYRRLFGSLADESLWMVALLKLEGHSNEEIARSLDCGLRTVERELDVIRKRWMAEDTPSMRTGPGPPVLRGAEGKERSRLPVTAVALRASKRTPASAVPRWPPTLPHVRF